ncbi:hypothetical protein N7E70_005540 [Aminobacter sp. NyZ550]|jgi:hypothetical protein|uniref:Uncharacterized protein n=2 Tax=Aminobacter TaxID=31988 RepID=A0AAC8YKM5_AMIAI|nr:MULTISPECIES: hypothetical protein [Aminobacter]AMS40175.1 hypothetical protein AA2016_1240 [Aminobacter aminovorans]MBA8910283.1 hypothetical protein [Aminobacter ciceronei]MBA9024063.1 hypothetical protein [Aminobacter ciceronei]MBB3709902.1 hypothetical protein [Aminobacter aminovorans]MRX35322.1 hypothetical protein [Aminobacter sp. MDW-2]
MASPRDSDGEKESRRILDRIARESDPGGASFVARKASEMRNHLGAADVDKADPIEHIGTRIGRILGFLLTIGLVLWLINYLVRGG